MARGGLAHWGKRWLYLIHRWIGIFTCLLFLIWFVSGLVMVYVPFPGLSGPERLAGLTAIEWSKVKIGPAEAERIASSNSPPLAITLEMVAGDPVWRIIPPTGSQVTLSATSGAPLRSFDAAHAARIAGFFARAPVAGVAQLERDQWTVPGSYDEHRPLHRVRLAGSDARDLYVSSTTGAVVLDTNANERFWNWLGSVPHWIYPTVLRQNNEAWRQVVMWVSGPCILVAVTGIWIGLLRTRLGSRRFAGGRATPYHGWMLWHHIAGLAGGLTLTLWIFSGWLSVDPGRLFASPGIDARAEAAYTGARPLPATEPALLKQAAGIGVKQLEFTWAAGRAWVVLHRVEGSAALDAGSFRPAKVSKEAMLAAASQLVPGAKVASVELLTAPDLYWYDVGALPQLPVLRVRFGDPAATWVHIDPNTGQLLGTIDARRRTYRWVFDLFHKWDLNVLTLNRPAWDVMLWLFSLIGIVMSASGIWVGWLRLRGRNRERGRGRGRKLSSPRATPQLGPQAYDLSR